MGGFGFTGLGSIGSQAVITVASAGTTDILSQSSLFIAISGTATITSFGADAASRRNQIKYVRATGAFTLTHNATSLILPGGANIVAANGDTFIVISDASSNARVYAYQRAAAVPVPATPGSVLLTSGTWSAVATGDLVLTSYTAYRGLKFVLSGMIPVNDGAFLQMRFSTDGGANYISSGYNYAMISLVDSSSTVFGTVSGSAAFIPVFAPDLGNGANEGCNLEVTILNQTSGAFWPRITCSGYGVTNAGTPEGVYTNGGGSNETAQDVDAVRFLFDTGNIASANYAVYGLL